MKIPMNTRVAQPIGKLPNSKDRRRQVRAAKFPSKTCKTCEELGLVLYRHQCILLHGNGL